jgi:hypothetical protein
MSAPDFCGYARESSDYMVLWSVAGKTCTQIHTSVWPSYDGNQTDDRHYQFALPQTFWRAGKIVDSFLVLCTLSLFFRVAFLQYISINLRTLILSIAICRHTHFADIMWIYFPYFISYCSSPLLNQFFLSLALSLKCFWWGWEREFEKRR